MTKCYVVRLLVVVFYFFLFIILIFHLLSSLFSNLSITFKTKDVGYLFRLNITRQQIFVYLLCLVFLYVCGVADANFDVSFCILSTVLKIFATD